MSAPRLFVDDWGTTFAASIVNIDDGAPVALDGTVVFRFSAPDGSSADVAATITSPSGGACEYTTIEGQIDQTGLWRWQPIVSQIAGDFAGTIHEFLVVSRL